MSGSREDEVVAATKSEQVRSGVRRALALPAVSRYDLPVPNMGYVPGLDGVRALAVIGVLLYHGNSAWLPGGFLGVDVFFVLSGFLISTILLQSLQTRGAINFKTFYVHRARRLLPALLATLLLAAVLIVLFARDSVSQFREDVIPALFYVANWSFIADEQSYFEAIGRAPVLQHLWSLAIEEQFYLLWPVLLLGLYRWRGRLGVGKVALYVALASTVLMATLAVVMNAPGENDASRLYFGTDTHSMGLLLGAALAAVWRPGALPRQLPRQRAIALTVVGALGTAVVIGSYLWMTDTGGFLYRGGFFLVCAGAAVMIAVVTHPAAMLGGAFALAPLRYLGTRSYGLYLYHWPIFAVTRPDLDLPFGGVAAFAVSMGLTLAVAEASYRYLEVPIRTGGWRRLWHSWLDRGDVARRSLIYGGTTAAALTALVVAIMVTPAPSAQDYLGGVTEVGAGSLEAGVSGRQADAAAGDGDTASGGDAAVGNPAPVPSVDPALQSTPVPLDAPITAVGDSVLLGAEPGLTPYLPGLTVDAAISRQPEDILARVSERQATATLGDVVIIHAGTNGAIPADGLRDTLSQLAGARRVVLVTSHVTEPWQEASNEAILAVAPEFANVRIADWNEAATGQSEYFVYDGVHLDDPGIAAYRSVLEAALQSN